jgi:uncharacterized protein (DUF1501 family)
MALNREMSRSEFLAGSAAAAATLLLGGGLSGLAFAAGPGGDGLLVVVFLRGGADGLNFVSPLSGDDRKQYEQERPNLAMPLSGPGALLPLDDRFGLHPRAQALHKLFQEKRLAVVHAVGCPVNNRSHFDVRNIMELGLAEKRNNESGWLARALGGLDPALHLPAAAISPTLPTSLYDFARGFSVTDMGRLNLAGKPALQEQQQQVLESLYANGTSWLHSAGTEALRTMAFLQKAPGSDAEEKTLDYPKNEIGNRLHTLRQVLHADLGLRAATVDMGGWDTHKFQGVGADGTFANQVGQLSDGLGTFVQDLDAHFPLLAPKTTILVMTEFGRRLRENANRGTDHGHGGVFFVIGRGINGGRVYGKWPGLATEKLYERADLAVTTDYRQVIAEILRDRLGNVPIGTVFPGFRPGKLGLVKAS